MREDVKIMLAKVWGIWGGQDLVRKQVDQGYVQEGKSIGKAKVVRKKHYLNKHLNKLSASRYSFCV